VCWMPVTVLISLFKSSEIVVVVLIAEFTAFYYIYIHALIAKIWGTPTNTLHYYIIKFFQTKCCNSNTFWTLVGHRQEVYINIFIKQRL
jgi:hypothetical protein